MNRCLGCGVKITELTDHEYCSPACAAGKRQIRVVNLKYEDYDQYIGRAVTPYHFGNPFSFKKNTLAFAHCNTIEESVLFYEQWLTTDKWWSVEPERKKWILDHLCDLKGQRLGCFCKDRNGQGVCHGDVLKKLVENRCG